MLKMYRRAHEAADHASFWEENWCHGNFADALRFCSVDPLRPLFERYVSNGKRLLEGGCGLGQYVAYYSQRGRWVVGLDFEKKALLELRERGPFLKLSAGDVGRLPFADATFDVYFSGGVVEHFENGPERALREAHRVLRPGGVLMVSVPYLSPLRRLAARFRKADRIRVNSTQTGEPPPRGWRFFQYVFTDREFLSILEHQGFRVIHQQGYAILFGLYEIPLVSVMVDFLWRRRRARPAMTGGSGIDVAPRAEPTRGLMRRLFVAEHDRIPCLGPLVRTMRWACGNMMMYVCLREGRANEEGPNEAS